MADRRTVAVGSSIIRNGDRVTTAKVDAQLRTAAQTARQQGGKK